MPRHGPINVRSFGPDGTITLEDGREMQAVVAPSGALGVRPKVVEDHVSALDQTGPAQKPPDLKSLGLDQI